MRFSRQIVSFFASVWAVGLCGQTVTSDSYFTRFGGEGDDVGYGIVTTSIHHGYAVIGQTSSFGAAQTDIYIARLDSMSIPVWQKNIGGFNQDIGKSIVELSDSGFVIAGYTNSSGIGGWDAYFVRTDKNGN